MKIEWRDIQNARWLHDVNCRCRHSYGEHMHIESAWVSSWCAECECPHFRPWFIAPWPYRYPPRAPMGG